MKKILFVILSAAAFLLSSCKPVNNDSTWLESYQTALSVAGKQNKNIFAYYSLTDADPVSKAVFENVLSTEEFIKEFSEDFVLVHLDFSDSLYEKAEGNSKEAVALKKVLDNNLIQAQRFDVRLPGICQIFSKEGYFITEIEPTEEPATLQDFTEYLENVRPQIVSFNEIVNKAVSGSKEEKLEAIDTLFNITAPQKSYGIIPFAKEYISLDKDNSKGNLYKYLNDIAFANATDKAIVDDIVGASEEFVQIGEDSRISKEEQQDAYISAALVLSNVGYNDYALMKDYLERAYVKAPESENSAMILASINQLEQTIVELGAAQNTQNGEAK